MGATSFLIGKMPDKTIISLIDAVQERYGCDHRSVLHSGLGLDDKEVEQLKSNRGSSYLITECRINTRQNVFSLAILRNPDVPDKLYYDTLTINHGSSPSPSARELMEFTELVRSKTKFPNADIPKGADKSAAALLEHQIASLASLNEKMFADATDLRRVFDEQDLVRKNAFDEQVRQREQEIAELEKASRERIASEQSELDKKRIELDLSDNMTARRKLRGDITSQVQEFLAKPLSSRATGRKLILVISLCSLGAIVTAGLAFESFLAFQSAVESRENSLAMERIDKIAQLEAENRALAEQVSNPNSKTMQASDTSASLLPDRTGYMLWMLALRGALLSAAAIGFVGYLISFVRKSHDEDITSQRELQRYGMDINRASWVIETVMEMSSKEKAQLPEHWVRGAVHGLFQSRGSQDSEVSSLAALGAVMGLGPEVSVGPDGANLKFSGKGAKQAAKDAE